MKTTIRIDKRLVDEVSEIFGAKCRSEAVNNALREFVALSRFKKLINNHSGKLNFAGYQ